MGPDEASRIIHEAIARVNLEAHIGPVVQIDRQGTLYDVRISNAGALFADYQAAIGEALEVHVGEILDADLLSR